MMAKGKRLDLPIGASFEDEWHQVEVTVQKQKKSILTPKEHRLVFKIEKRRGKSVTLAGPFHLEKSEATVVLKSLKKRLGCGGTFKDEWMEFQGDLRIKLRPLLSDHHFCLK